MFEIFEHLEQKVEIFEILRVEIIQVDGSQFNPQLKLLTRLGVNQFSG